MSTVKTKITGPWFENGEQVIDNIVTAVALEVGESGKETVLFGLDHTLRNPTGAYRSAVTLYASRGQSRVHDQRSLYGPWLEGTGSRNKTTRFKGYWNYRQATQQLDRTARTIADRVVAEHLAKLG